MSHSMQNRTLLRSEVLGLVLKKLASTLQKQTAQITAKGNIQKADCKPKPTVKSTVRTVQEVTEHTEYTIQHGTGRLIFSLLLYTVIIA